MSLIKMENITKVYKRKRQQVQALSEINFEIEEGAMIAIMGASGSGKTSLLNILGILDNEYEGKYFFKNKDIKNLSKKEKIVGILKKLGIEDKEKSTIRELSGGQSQRVAIARALINDPSVILADEPTGALDSKTGMEVIEILKGLNKQGKTIIIVTHDINVAQKCNKVYKIVDGKIIQKTAN